MNIREPRHFEGLRAQRQAHHRNTRVRKFVTSMFVAGFIVAVLGLIAYERPLPKLDAKVITPTTSSQAVALNWPSNAQAAIGVNGQGVVAATTNQKAVPTASVAKVMLALAVVSKYPLSSGQIGPAVPITQADVDIYNKYVSIDGSVAQVQVGESLTEYQALQAVLLPSANNVADTLAIWAYGSMAAYLQAANQMAQNLGMTQSTFAGDASGFLPETVSTPHDLVLLGQAALANPVIKSIISQSQATLPVEGQVSNVNFLVGQDGNIGIKTGNSDQAGGCYLFAYDRTVGSGRKVTVIGAVMATPNLVQAINASSPLAGSFYQGFGDVTVVPKGTVVGQYNLPWGGNVSAVAAQDAVVLNWRGSKAKVTIEPVKLASTSVKGAKAGTMTTTTPYAKSVTPVILQTSVPQPHWWWRLRRSGI